MRSVELACGAFAEMTREQFLDFRNGSKADLVRNPTYWLNLPMITVAQALADLQRYAAAESDAYPVVRWHENGEEEAEFYNDIGRELALGYAEGRYTFEFGDFVANALWVNYIQRFEEMPPALLAKKVYEAFDAGEMGNSTSPDDDPIKAYTEPMIARIVAEL